MEDDIITTREIIDLTTNVKLLVEEVKRTNELVHRHDIVLFGEKGDNGIAFAVKEIVSWRKMISRFFYPIMLAAILGAMGFMWMLLIFETPVARMLGR